MKLMWMVLLITFIPSCSFATEVTTVHVQVGKVSEVFFPENIAKVIKGGTADSILVEAMESSLYILPKTDKPPEVFVTGVSGQSYPLSLQISQEHDLKVEVGKARLKRSSYAGNLNVMDLMKEVLLGHVPAGATTIKLDQILELKHTPIQLKFFEAYDLPTIRVYVASAINRSPDLVVLPIESITIKGLKAITSTADTLNPTGSDGDKATVYLVVIK